MTTMRTRMTMRTGKRTTTMRTRTAIMRTKRTTTTAAAMATTAQHKGFSSTSTAERAR